MEIIRDKMRNLRTDAVSNALRAEEAENRVINLEQEAEQLRHRLAVLDTELDKAESKLAERKLTDNGGDQSEPTNDGTAKRILLLEEELDREKRNLKATTEKLKQANIKAENLEIQVAQLE
ncbi:tropomyosin [Flagelloscypha sp. PMI_526]|nr:tropomyosin [Flagelloscypha sp. PMI_526]